MAKKIFQAAGYTATATSDSTVQHAQFTYQVVKGATATQKIDILEVMVSGLATSSTVSTMQLGARWADRLDITGARGGICRRWGYGWSRGRFHGCPAVAASDLCQHVHWHYRTGTLLGCS